MKRIGSSVVVFVLLIGACDRRDSTAAPNDNARGMPPAPVAPATPTVAPERGVAALVAGGGPNGLMDAGAERGHEHRKAEGEFKAAKGIKLNGKAKLEELANGVRVSVEVKDAPPGVKGIHIHEKPDCSDIPGKSMGEHFAPNVKTHGLPPNPSRHLGDLGNITVDKSGNGKIEMVVPNANLRDDDPMSFLNRAMVIHEGEDQGSQPSGNSGRPMACAVIKKD